MQMTPGEIRRNYEAAKNKRAQIDILADLNCCSRAKIKKILFGDSAKSTSEQCKESTVDTPQENAEGVKELLNLDSVKEVLYRHLDELNSQIRTLEEEYRKVTIAIEVLGNIEKEGAIC